MIADPIRPRLVLVTTPLADADAEAGLRNALSGGDVASVIIDPAGRDADAFQRFAEPLVPLIQAAGAAAIIADDTRCAGRLKADGIHLTAGDIAALGEAVERFSPKLIVGCSGFETRHEALEAGERLPDYLLFGRFGGDTDPEVHPKNLKMAEWWAEIVEVPCILMMGNTIESAEAASSSGAEFVAAAAAIFADVGEAGARVARVNAILDAWFERAAA